MANQVPWNTILEIIGRFTHGASLEEIMEGLLPPVPRRTLQRWLANLVKNGQISIIGMARASRYKLVAIPLEEPSSEKEKLSGISLSEEGHFLELQVTRPIPSRHPVSYHREFLEDYRPNKSFYLPEELRRKLFILGGGDKESYPAGTLARQIFQRLLIDLSWNSSRLEGNTYSLLETERLLALGKEAAGKNAEETQMILNHKAAIEFIVNSASEIGMNSYTISCLHALLSDNLLPDPSACGRIRTMAVGIGKSVYLPSAIPQVIEECFRLLLSKASSIDDPIERAFFLMVHLPYLQPFDDVNKRTSRLAANIPLIQNNLSPLSFIDVPEKAYINGLLAIYELNRMELLRDVFAFAYERSCVLYAATRKSIGEPDPFRLQYRTFVQQVVTEIVLDHMDKVQAVAFIKKYAIEKIKKEDQSRFIEMIERELQSLHEGNIARFHLKPSQYDTWKKTWI